MINYSQINKLSGLPLYLCTTPEYLHQVLDSSIIFYKVVKIPKRGGKGHRTLFLANDILRPIQKIIRDDLAYRSTWQSCVHGFIQGRSIVTNARHHIGKQTILNLDIRHFFESISHAKVAKVFSDLGANSEISNALASICTCNGYLVPGTVCAPILSNLVFKDCDSELLKIAEKTNNNFTRYVDDLSFSGKFAPSIKEIDLILQSHGFTRNITKTYLQKRGRRQYVTGLTVFDHKYPRIPKWKKEEFRKVIYFVNKFGVQNHLHRINSTEPVGEFINRYRGLISYYRSIEPCFIESFEQKMQFNFLFP